MHNRTIDYEGLRVENFQLKNQITDLKNAFDLNRDVLKILEDQSKISKPNNHIFYQIISRLTGINNQIMLTNLELVQEKSRLTTHKKKMEDTIDQLNQKLKEIMNVKPAPVNEIIFQMRMEIKTLHNEILALNEECLRKRIQITELQEALTMKEVVEMKRPLIPSVKTEEEQNSLYGHMTQRSYISEIPIRNMGNDILREKITSENLKQENKKLKKLIEQLEFRLTLMTSIYKIEPPEKQRHEESQPQEDEKKVSEGQLSLLLFALQNTELEQEEETENVKLTITKRCKNMIQNKEEVERTKSCPK